jgi:AraC-like DNA-binding protein
MDYHTFQPHQDLESLVSCYWTLEVPADAEKQRQRIVPDGCLEMAFILGDDIKRYTTTDEYILQPRAMVLGQTIEPFYIEPVGYVNTFAVRFYPYGFSNFVSVPLKNLVNKETPIELLFDPAKANELQRKIIHAVGTKERIEMVEVFLFDQLNEESTIDKIVKSTVETLLLTKGSAPIKSIIREDLSIRRQLERKFKEQIGISPKQLAKVIRLQSALKMVIHRDTENLTNIAYENAYYDQAHFIKDFREFTGTLPKEFLGDEHMALSALFYK